jgi:hypothetical protein
MERLPVYVSHRQCKDKIGKTEGIAHAYVTAPGNNIELT